MDNILLSAALSFIITYFCIPAIIKVAIQKKLYDEPDERKVHTKVIPTLGGLGIFVGFILALLLGVNFAQNPGFQFFAAAFIIIFFIGIKDDIVVISPLKKLIAQLISAAIIIHFGGVRLDNMYGFFGINEVPYIFSLVLTAFTMIVITNAFNLIDGVDGLAGGIGLVTSCIFGTVFYSTSQLALSVMAFSFAGGLFAFLIYNFSPAKIFMGDTGSLLLGTVSSILVIEFINTIGRGVEGIPAQAAPAIGIAILAVPLFDTLRVFTLRILSRRSPFSPDRTHIHHYLLDLGFSHRKIAISSAIATLFFSALAYAMRYFNPLITVITMLAIALAITGVIIHYRKKKKITTNRTEIKVQNLIPKFAKSPITKIVREKELVEAD